jgi:hypothetical protein
MSDYPASPISQRNIRTFKAGAAITKGIAIMADTSTGEGYVKPATDGVATVIGIAAEAQSTTGGFVKVDLIGPVVIAVANGALSYGDAVNSAAATGKIDTAGAAERAIGIALEAATAQDDEIAIVFSHHVTPA